jgi:hypothetical protein
MNKGIIMARIDVQAGNHTRYKKITRSHPAARIYALLKDKQ